MNRSIQFSRIDTESQITEYDLDRFAESFNHEVSRIFPIWSAHMDGRLLSYCHMHTQVIAYPAVKPDISPREFYQLAWTWFSKIKQEYGDPLVAVSQPGTGRLFSKVGLVPFGKELYSIRD